MTSTWLTLDGNSKMTDLAKQLIRDVIEAKPSKSELLKRFGGKQAKPFKDKKSVKDKD